MIVRDLFGILPPGYVAEPRVKRGEQSDEYEVFPRLERHADRQDANECVKMVARAASPGQIVVYSLSPDKCDARAVRRRVSTSAGKRSQRGRARARRIV